VLLVVEDEPVMQEWLASELTHAGFEVAMACDGNAAIAELDTRAERFKAVITDIRLGTGPDGWEVARHARELVPDMAVVYVSGDSGHAWPSKGVPGSVLVSKPFAVAQIINAVSTLVTETDTRRTVSGGDG
jgi:DNA-binding response OmpR family regulator